MLPSDLKGAVFTMAMANGDESTFEQLVKVCVICVCFCVFVEKERIIMIC